MDGLVACFGEGKRLSKGLQTSIRHKEGRVPGSSPSGNNLLPCN